MDRSGHLIKQAVAQDKPCLSNIGISLLRRTQAEAASPLLHATRKLFERLPFDQTQHPRDDEEIQEALQDWDAEQGEDGFNPDVEGLSDEPCQAKTRKRKRSRNPPTPSAGSQAILAKVKDVRELWPGEKILIVSEFVLLLDIIKEGIQRRSKTDAKFKFPLTEYNGTVNLENRARA
ncbi:hypothetical protein FOBRF1_000617 [Fusarium oxysporum]